MSILVLAEHDQSDLKSATRHAITAALKLGGEVRVVVAGRACRSVAEQAARVPGVAKVLLADGDAYAHSLPENVAELLVHLAAGCTHVLAAATAAGKSTLPRVAALL